MKVPNRLARSRSNENPFGRSELCERTASTRSRAETSGWPNCLGRAARIGATNDPNSRWDPAIELSPYWQRRFAADMVKCIDKAHFTN